MISTLKNNITLLKIQRKSLQRSLEMMDNNWGTYTNEAGFKMADSKFMKTLMDKEYICPFSHIHLMVVLNHFLLKCTK